MYIYYQPNPCGRSVGDCSVRAISAAFNIDWEEAFDILASFAKSMCDMPAAVEEYGNVTSTAIVKVPRGCCFSVSVRTVSASNDPTVTPTPVVEVQNANFVIDRIA